MKTSKKITALLVALVLMFALTVPAFASDSDERGFGNGEEPWIKLDDVFIYLSDARQDDIDGSATRGSYTLYNTFDVSVYEICTGKMNIKWVYDNVTGAVTSVISTSFENSWTLHNINKWNGLRNPQYTRAETGTYIGDKYIIFHFSIEAYLVGTGWKTYSGSTGTIWMIP